MNTWSTEVIEQGGSFPEYVWRCARAFGAMIQMRDDPLDAPIPDAFEPNRYEFNRIVETEAALATLDRMTLTDVAEKIRAETDEARESNLRYQREYEEKDRKYRAMRAEVEAWEPPTADHAGLKQFMLNQIDQSNPGWGPHQVTPPIADPAAWIADRRADLQRDLARCREEWDKEVARTDGRNDWIRRLRESVPPEGGGSWRARDPLF